MIKQKFDELFSLFPEKDIYIPATIGYVKPEKEAYQYILNNANLNGQEIFFVDDSLTNVESAKKHNIKSILHKGNWQETEAELKQNGLNLK